MVIDKKNRHVQKIIEAYEELGAGQWNLIESKSLYLNNGVIVINNQIDRETARSRFTGQIHIFIMWYRIEDIVGRGLQSKSQITTVNKTPKYYTIPESYRK